MDVTFTNVLEGARQYFQGLPAATSSAAGPTYSNPSEADHNSDVPPSSSAYWPPAPQENRPPTREQTPIQRPPSHHSDTSRPHSQMGANVINHYQGNYQQQEQQQQQSFQFPRPHSREAPSNQYQVQYRDQPASSQSYHQMQNVGQTAQGYYQQQQQQQRAYYQNQTKLTSNNAYKQQNSQENPYYKHLYSPHAQMQQTSNQQQNQNTSQGVYRTTHNLPPIASLSLISYPSSRTNRDVIRTSQTKTRTVPTNSLNQQVPKSTISASMRGYPEQQPDYQQYQNQNRLPVNQNYHYGTTATTQNYNQVVTTTSNAANYTATVPPNNQSSSIVPQYYQTNKPQQQNINGRIQPVVKQKRESPLDLSVKTVRTPADSTLDDVDQTAKYYNRTTTHNYPTYDVYANSFQRTQQQVRPTATAPKVEFHPNFNVSALNQTHLNNYRRNPVVVEKPIGTQRVAGYPTTQNNRYPTVSVPTAAHVNSYIQSQTAKRTVENLPRIDFPTPGHGHKTSALYPVPTHDTQKKRPADTAPSSIIPNKMSKVDTWRQSIDQQIEQKLSSYKQQQQAKQIAKPATVNGNYPTTQNPYQNNRQQYPQYSAGGPQYPQNHNQTYVPSAGAHQYPNYGYPQQPQQQLYTQQTIARTNSNPSLASIGKHTLGGADKRVLSLLRNSLEIKGAKEAQKKLEQEQLKHSRLDVQHPSTDVTAPLQPKPGFVNRHNVSPFTPTNLPDNNNSLMYKLHIPKAIDSVNFECDKYLGQNSNSQMEDSQSLINHANPGGDLDGLAALVAARIRTKAELKQVGSSETKPENSVSPPKLSKERHSFPPRRRLFSRNEEEGGNSTNVPLRDKTGLRSSSETSVFDFPDSDSEGEMPVLERQTLEDMRRDRRSSSTKQLTELKSESPAPDDDIFTQACDNFMEQLKSGSGKKRGRRKKLEADVLAKLESVTKEKPLTVKTETEEIKKEDHEDEDEDVPLIACKIKSEEDEQKAKQVPAVPPRPAKKPSFGDGSHFCPGWEEEVYKYKKSLRMPPSLIQVTRPPRYHRLSTSLPDLDPCPHSPTPSSVTDDYPRNKLSKIKSENLDSDTESNHSFNIFSCKHYDSEGSSSIKSLPNTTKESNSILDRLLEKYGGRRKKKHKRKEEPHPKVTPKADKIVELLPTPAKSPDFRKKTIENFKDVFTKKSKERRILKQRVTIKEVFGEDRPASAPPVTCVNHIKIKEEMPDIDDNINLSSLIKKEDDTRQVLKNKLLNRGRKDDGNLFKTLADKKIKSELLDEQDDDDHDSKSETPSIDGDEGSLSGKKQRNKFRNIRRKFSSGFDYIRKKKKHVKKDNQENETKKRKGPIMKNPGSVQDIQKEIKGWVLNKGIGETILHRSARLGYTDITAYCLEKMECSPSPKDNAGYTPLHEASTKGHLGIAKMLLMYGANVHESARGGIRPLHEAVENGYVEVVRLLLSYGADPMLATYSGMTPMALASDDATVKLLQNHINDIEGSPTSPWTFTGPASCFDPKDTGYDVLEDDPDPDPVSEEEDVEFEVSDCILPNLYTLRGEPNGDRWILLQDLSSLLKIKSRDALLRQICPSGASGSHINYKSVLRELKMSDFLEQAHCCQFLNIGEKVNTRASKIALVKYTDKVRELLNVEKVTISVR